MKALVNIECWDQITDAISRVQTAGAEHRVQFLRALYRGEIAPPKTWRNGSSSTFKGCTAGVQPPGLVLIGDDDYATSNGPEAWLMARRIIRWARFIIIHGGASNGRLYELAVGLAERYRPLVMVECSSAKIADCESAASQCGTSAEALVMRPPPGKIHPPLGKRDNLH